MRSARLLLCLPILLAWCPAALPQDSYPPDPQSKSASGTISKAATDAETQLQKALADAGNDRAALVRNLRTYLLRFPDSPRKAGVYRALIESFLDSRRDLECFRPPAGTVFFPRLTHGDPETFIKLLREKYETTVVPGTFFEMPQHFRIGIGGDTAGLRAGLERLSAALDDFAKR